ncbi:hypothetical protein Leryth_012318 [Lithospermum erythrorhizon]|nr:hypothetical protein Leryth_012318 [Lithospermum erythrorhizon]
MDSNLDDSVKLIIEFLFFLEILTSEGALARIFLKPVLRLRLDIDILQGIGGHFRDGWYENVSSWKATCFKNFSILIQTPIRFVNPLYRPSNFPLVLSSPELLGAWRFDSPLPTPPPWRKTSPPPKPPPPLAASFTTAP